MLAAYSKMNSGLFALRCRAQLLNLNLPKMFVQPWQIPALRSLPAQGKEQTFGEEERKGRKQGKCLEPDLCQSGASSLEMNR